MASILDLFPSSKTVIDPNGQSREESVAPKATILDLLRQLFGVSNEPRGRGPVQHGPGFDEPMQHPVPAREKKYAPDPSMPLVFAAEDTQPQEDILRGYNKARGVPQQQILDLIQAAAAKHKVDPSLIAAILFNESGFKPNAYNENVNESGIKSRDRGIAQINDLAHPDITDQQANDPNFAIDFMARKLASDVGFMGNPTLGTAAYNVGRRGATERRPKGKEYLQKVYQNLTPEYAKELGFDPSLY